MTAKEYLSQYYWAKKEIESKREEIRQLEAMAEYSSPKWVSGSSGVSDKIGNVSAKIIDKAEELNRLIEKSMELLYEIEVCINRMEGERYRYILTERYINCRKWESIADDLHIDTRWLRRLHKRALNKIDP